MARILCLETSTEICSVCICSEMQILSYQESLKSRSHTKVITRLIAASIQESEISYKDLDAIALASGPGSYTSLRIGSATAKGLCYGLEIPFIAMDSLKVIAAGMVKGANPDDLLVPMIDARRQEVYYAIYDHALNEVNPVSNLILEKDSFDNYSDKNLHFGGDGSIKAQEILKTDHGIFQDVKSSAQWMASLAHDAFIAANFSDLAYFSPNYYKNPNITQSRKRLF